MLCAAAPAQNPSVTVILRNHAAALQRLHAKETSTYDVSGKLEGFGLTGEFHEWQDGTSQRRDQRLGLRTEHLLRIGNHTWAQNANGQIREMQGAGAQEVTEDFIDTQAFESRDVNVRFLERATLKDGRTVYRLEVEPRGRDPFVIGIDTTTWLVDEKSYVAGDVVLEDYFDDYRVTDGFLTPFKRVHSSGTNAAYDITETVEQVNVGQQIAASVFAPLAPLGVDEHGPVSVPVEVHNNHPFVVVNIGGHSYHFLVDSGSQVDVIDPSVVSDLGLHPQGSVEIEGAARARGVGAVLVPPMNIGSATFTNQVASVFDLGQISRGTIKIDGVLGLPFFSAAELRFDPDKNTLTLAPPGTLSVVGEKIDVETDRNFVEVPGTIDREADVKLVVDTGNSEEMLVYGNFIAAHPSMVSYLGGKPIQNQAAGGSMRAVSAFVDDLQLGQFHLFNRRANVILTPSGAFDNRNDSGNVGFSTLHNFVTTFDYSNKALYLARAGTFDDGHDRPRTDSIKDSAPIH